MRTLLIIAFLVVVVPIGAAGERKDAVQIPGGVADAAGNVGYLSQSKQGVVALDLEKGAVLWESNEGRRPLALTESKLATLKTEKGKANVLRVVVLDVTAKGKKVVESEAIVLPEWAVAGDGLDHFEAGKIFSARGWVDKSDLILQWTAGSRYFGGAAPPPEVLKEATKDANGIARVDLTSGKVQTKDEKLPTPPDKGFDPSKLPKELREIADREGWQAAVVLGPRAYGKIQKMAGRPGGFGGTQHTLIQAVDLRTGRLLWERVYEERQILPPPP